MKKILILGLLLASCASQKPKCDAYSKEEYCVIEIEIKLPRVHHHFENKPHCIWITETDYVYYDTMPKPILEENEIKRVKHLATQNQHKL